MIESAGAAFSAVPRYMAAFAAAVVAVASAACGGGGTAAEATPLAPRVTCDRMLAGPLPPDAVVRGRLAGDVDGDGRRDRAAVVYSKSAPTECASVLRVERSGHLFARALRAGISPESRSAAPHDVPRLTALAPVDGYRGAELLVTVWDGASTSFGSLFAVRGTRLVRLSVPSSVAGVTDVVAYSGSLGHSSALQCRHGRHGMVAIGAAKAGRGWDILRFSLSPRADRFVITQRQSQRVGSLPAAFRSPPLGGCAVASSAR